MPFNCADFSVSHPLQGGRGAWLLMLPSLPLPLQGVGGLGFRSVSSLQGAGGAPVLLSLSLPLQGVGGLLSSFFAK